MKKMNLLSTLVVASMSLMLCGCANHNAVVTVNGEAITKAQYEKAFNTVASNSMFSQMGVDVKKDKNSFIHIMLKDRVINEMIIKKIIDQEFEKRHIKASKEDMDKQLKVIIDKVGSKEKLNKLLKENGVSTAQFKKDLADEVKIQKLVDELSLNVVSDKDVERFYNDNKAKFNYPDRVKASHILVSANPEEIKVRLTSTDEGKKMTEADVDAAVKKEMADKKAKAEKLLAEAKKNPAEFAKLAKENSDDTVSAQQGGDLGFFGEAEMVEAFSKAAFSMKPNTISEIVQTPYGYHIILVTDRQKAGVEPFDKVKTEIKEFLTNQGKVRILQQFVDGLKNNAKIEYNDSSFDPKNIRKAIEEQQKQAPSLKESQRPTK